MSPASELGLPAEVPDFSQAAPALARAGAAGARPFLIQSERGHADGDLKGGLGRVRLGGLDVAEGPRLEGTTGVNFVLSPGTLRREIVGPAGSALETSLLPPTLPLLAVRWDRVMRPATALDLVLLPDIETVEHTEDGPSVTAWPSGSDVRVTAALCGSRGDWRITTRAGGGLALRCSLEPGEAPTVLVAQGSEAAIRAAMRAAPHLAAHAPRAASPLPGLEVRTGVEKLDDAVAWARVRLAYGLSGAASSPAPEGALWTGLAALAVGDLDAARRATDLLSDAAGPGSPAAILAARAALATGAVRDGGAEALRTLANLGEPRRTLPMAGAPASRAFLDWGSAGPSAAPPPTGSALADELLEAWRRLHADPDAGWSAWRNALARGYEAGPRGPGTWDEDADIATATGVLLCFLVHGLWGFVPDAPKGRVRLAPCLPSHLTAFAIEGLRVGDTALSARYDREGTWHRFTLEPEAGRVPAMIVLEPMLPGRTLVEARVDGEPAQLDSGWTGVRAQPRIQLPLDAPRSVELHLE